MPPFSAAFAWGMDQPKAVEEGAVPLHSVLLLLLLRPTPRAARGPC